MWLADHGTSGPEVVLGLSGPSQPPINDRGRRWKSQREGWLGVLL